MSEQSNTHSIERDIIGSILIDEQNYWSISDILEKRDFMDKDNQELFSVMSTMCSNGKAVRIKTVAAQLPKLQSGELTHAVLAAIKLQVKNSIDSEGPIPLQEYAEVMHLERTRWDVNRMISDSGKKVAENKEDPINAANEIIIRANEIVSRAERVHQKPISSVVSSVAKKINAAASGQAIGFTTGLRDLDDMIGTIGEGQVTIWGGNPGSFKTASALQVGRNIAKRDGVGFFQLEMTADEMVMRCVAGETGIPVQVLESGLNEEQLEKVYQAQGKISAERMHIIAKRDMSITEIISRIYTLYHMHGVKVFIVDHIGLIRRPHESRLKDYECVNRCVQDLHGVAKALGVPIIMLCHLTKGARQESKSEPVMEDFYGGGIEQHADLMLCNFNRHDFLEKNKPLVEKQIERWAQELSRSKGRLEIFKLKHRKGKGREVRKFHLIEQRMLIQDIPDSRQDQYSLIGEPQLEQ